MNKAHRVRTRKQARHTSLYRLPSADYARVNRDDMLGWTTFILSHRQARAHASLLFRAASRKSPSASSSEWKRSPCSPPRSGDRRQTARLSLLHVRALQDPLGEAVRVTFFQSIQFLNFARDMSSVHLFEVRLLVNEMHARFQ